MKPAIRFLLKLIVSVGLLGWVLSQTDLRSVAEAFTQCHLGLLLAAFALHFVGFLISVVRWHVLLQALSIEAPFSHLFKSYLVGFFFNTFLPSTVGGDIVRTLDTREQAGGGTRSLAVIFVERFTGFFAMVLLAALALPFAGEVIPPGFYIPQMVAALCFLFFLFVWVVLQPQSVLRLSPESRLAHFHTCLAAYSSRLPQLALAFFWGFLLQVNVVFHYYLLCLALGLHLPLLFLFIVIPLLKIFLLFPISVNGIGLRENAFAYFLQGKGVAIASSLALSWLDLGMTLVFALIGGAVYVGRRQKTARG